MSGYLPVPGGMVWYRRSGSGGGTPLLVVHGGPGAGSDYLAVLAELGTDRPVLFYDQLGCGRSECPDDLALWTLDRFVTEIRMVRRALRLREFHLFGHSWGGWLALEYVLRHGRGVRALVLASTSAGMAEHREELDRLRSELPPPVAAELDHRGGPVDRDSSGYRAALLHFYQRHLCCLEEWPDELVTVLARQRDNAAYHQLVGPNELTITGALADWDRTADLGAVTAPALVTVGRQDEITPGCARTLHRGIPNARLEIFERSAHVPHLEEPDHYLDVLAEFLRTCDRQQTDKQGDSR